MDKKLISNIAWAMTGQVGYILVGLVATIVLGRILSPEDFGLVGIGMFFVGVFNVLVESGMGGALVRKEHVTSKDYSTIFVFNLFVSVVLCLLLIGFSDTIAKFYERDDLRMVLVALSSILIFNAFTITQNARLVKNMQFKRRGIYKFISLFVSVVISVFIALKGGGVWAIVAMQVLSAFLLMIILWFKERGIDRIVFSKNSFKEMAAFGLYTTLSSLLNAIFENVYQLVLGKYFALNQVGYYYHAKKIQEAPDTISKLVILQVFYAHLSKLQNKLEAFRVSYITIAKFCAIVLGLTTCLIYIYAEEIIQLILGEKWIDSVFFLRILVVAGFFNLQEMVNRNIFKIFNQTHKIFYLELIKKLIQTISIVVGVIQNDIKILLYGFVLTAFISYFINYYFSRKVVDGISTNELWIFIKTLFAAVISTLFVSLIISYFDLGAYVGLVFVPVFVLLYFLILHFLNVQDLRDLRRYKSLIKANNYDKKDI